MLVLPFAQRERNRADGMKGESCSPECTCVFVNIINHRLADGGVNCTCGINMTQRILLFTNINWRFHQACHERDKEKMFSWICIVQKHADYTYTHMQYPCDQQLHLPHYPTPEALQHCERHDVPTDLHSGVTYNSLVF